MNHVIIVMQENHSFDNYFGVLPYAPGSPYHPGPCDRNDHACVDGLTCSRAGAALACTNSNPDTGAPDVVSFHLRNYCPVPDLNHEWPGSHQEASFASPTRTLERSPNDGFVRVNDATEQIDTAEGPTEDETMGYYDQTDLPFYYALARTFAIGDRYFSSVLGPTFPNRAYALAATSFGHLTTAEIFPPPPSPGAPLGGYKPITGTIMDLLDENGVSWTNYFSDLPTTNIFRGADFRHALPIPAFFAATTNPLGCGLPAVSFVDPAFGFAGVENDEHPPSSIQNGQLFVSQVVRAVRSGACWQDSIVFISYDEHGGFYDHVAPPRAKQGGARNPDGIDPGLCADESNPPVSEEPGGGAQCDVSRVDAVALCPDFHPPGPYPPSCPNFDQLGFRVPFIAVSPFSRPHYVSHEVADHTSVLAFIEKRFLSADGEGDDEGEEEHGEGRVHLTARDRHASTLMDLFDFNRAPSLRSTVPELLLPAGCVAPP